MLGAPSREDEPPAAQLVDDSTPNCVFFYDVVRQLGERVAREVSTGSSGHTRMDTFMYSRSTPSPSQHASNEHNDNDFDSQLDPKHDMVGAWNRRANGQIKKSAQQELNYSVKHYYAAIAIYAAFRNNRFCSSLQQKMEEEKTEEEKAEKKGK
jgi:hypothetical protein